MEELKQSSESNVSISAGSNYNNSSLI